MENDPQNDVEVTADDELSEETLGDVNGGMDWKRSPG
jgi:hypothetical protein